MGLLKGRLILFKTKTEAAAWLAGIIDGEGHIGFRKATSRSPRGMVREVRITNTDRSLLIAVHEALDLLGVERAEYDRSERERLGSKPIFDIVITRKANLELLASQITLRSAKAVQLQAMLGSYIRGHKPSRDVLAGLVAEGLTDAKIGERYGVTSGAVWFWRKGYGLPSR